MWLLGCLGCVGLQTCYNLFVLLYLVVIVLWGQKVWQIISKGGPMHSVLKMLSFTVIMEFISSLLMGLYYWRCVCLCLYVLSLCQYLCVCMCVCMCVILYVCMYVRACFCMYRIVGKFGELDSF